MKVILRVEPKNQTHWQPEDTTPIIPQISPNRRLAHDQQPHTSNETTYLELQPPLVGYFGDASTSNPSCDSPRTGDRTPSDAQRTTAPFDPSISGTCDAPMTERGLIAKAPGIGCLPSSSTPTIRLPFLGPTADNLRPQLSDGRVLSRHEYERSL